MNTQSQKGFAHAVLIIGLVIALIGALGFVFWQNFIYKEPTASDLVVVKKDTKQNNTDETKSEKRMPLGDFTFVAPPTWSDIKKDSSDPIAIQRYSFKLGSDIKADGVVFSRTYISLYKTTDVNIDAGSQYAFSYSQSDKIWSQTTKKPVKDMDGIFLDLFGDGMNGQYSITSRYIFVKDDYAVVVGVDEEGDDTSKYTKTSSTTTSKSNELQKQVVGLLNSVE